VLTSETGVVERREDALLVLQIALQQEKQEITQIDMEIHGSDQAR